MTGNEAKENLMHVLLVKMMKKSAAYAEVNGNKWSINKAANKTNKSFYAYIRRKSKSKVPDHHLTGKESKRCVVIRRLTCPFYVSPQQNTSCDQTLKPLKG